ncbi:hypothetical protein [Flavobacterium sp. UMI-01]|uniref:hypothetical protein n=1 Tax=Flavobacterium sp. UMI-01 TaxID=1441053 RepID=UPI001C7E1676|nr:hypothetical protein [Flavobacterium sp. UMI-01]
MKKKSIIIAFSLGLTVLLSILVQSFHAYVHHSEQEVQAYCHHENDGNKGQFTHHHYKAEPCKVCHFSFGQYVVTAIAHYHFYIDYTLIPFFSILIEKVISFPGSLYSLRGPPIYSIF